jgi:hypothetical protein
MAEHYKACAGQHSGLYASCLNNLATMEAEALRFHDAQVTFVAASEAFAAALGKDNKEYLLCQENLRDLLLSRCGRGSLQVTVLSLMFPERSMPARYALRVKFGDECIISRFQEGPPWVWNQNHCFTNFHTDMTMLKISLCRLVFDTSSISQNLRPRWVKVGVLHLALRDIFRTQGALEDEGAEWIIDTSAASPVTRFLRAYHNQNVDSVNTPSMNEASPHLMYPSPPPPSVMDVVRDGALR